MIANGYAQELGISIDFDPTVQEVGAADKDVIQLVKVQS
jgi:hypothetical protein